MRVRKRVRAERTGVLRVVEAMLRKGLRISAGRSRLRRGGAIVAAVVVLTACAAEAAAGPRYTVLVFSKTAGFRHASIPAGIAMIEQLGAAHDFAVITSEDAAVFSDAGLADVDVVVFLNTTGDILNASQEAAFEAYIRRGGGFVGIHSATDTEYDWEFYGELIGVYFFNHPAVQPAEIYVEAATHPSTAGLPEPWVRTDEWYNFRGNPRGSVRVLATIDESTYSGGMMGADHPIAWCHEHEGGRSWYTAGGHTSGSFSEPLFVQHVLGGIEWAARAACGTDIDSDGTVGFEDLVELLGAYGSDSRRCDVDGDGKVGFGDLVALFGKYGEAC